MTESASGQAKPLEWIGSSKKDLLALPEEVVDVFGYALHLAQTGKKHPQAKPLHGFGSAGVATPKPDVDLIRNRLKVAAKRAKELEDEQPQN